MESILRQNYTLPGGATLAIVLEAARPLTAPEVDLMSRLVQAVERSTLLREAGDG